jgi:hypothetical protein
MKWKCAVGLVAFALILACGVCGSAEAGVDISRYMPWQAGQWTILQEYDPLDSSCEPCYLKKEEKGGNIVSKSGSYTIVSHYNYDGVAAVWEEAGGMKLLRTADFVKLVAAKIDNKWWTFKPVISIPRSLNVNQPFVYNGVSTYGTTNRPFSLILTIAKTGISMTTPAGPFADCIQAQWIYVPSRETAQIETKVMAKGVGDVKVWNASLDREATGFAARAFGADTEYHEVIERGLSGPPFP